MGAVLRKLLDEAELFQPPEAVSQKIRADAGESLERARDQARVQLEARGKILCATRGGKLPPRLIDFFKHQIFSR